MSLDIRPDVSLAHLTSLGVGGAARWLVRVRDADDVREALALAREHGVPWWVLGGGSNVVVADAGLPGVVMHPTGAGLRYLADGRVRAEAGVIWDELVQGSVGRGLGGIECLSGIPGLCGAAPIQNIGAYGQEVGDVTESVEAVDVHSGETVTLTAQQCGFAYRDSVFKRTPGRYVVVAVTLALRVRAVPTLRYGQLLEALADQALPAGVVGLQRVREAVLRLRRNKSMVLDASDSESRSVGSFFVNPLVTTAQAEAVRAKLQADASMPAWPTATPGEVKLSAAWLIEQSGMERGYSLGAIGLSRHHALALVHRGGGNAAEVLSFARHVQDRVHAQCGVALVIEPVLLGFPPPPSVA